MHRLSFPSSTIYWCNIGSIYSQCLVNENILGIYWTNIYCANELCYEGYYVYGLSDYS